MAEQGDIKQMQCMEVFGGNRAVRQELRSPGLETWLESRPHQSDAGGDIHFLSMCGSGRVTRLAIADVSGHGASASGMAARLRGMMAKHVNLLDQRRLARRLNKELTLGERDSPGQFATVALMTYFAPTDHLILCNAGHPPPLWYSTRRQEWDWLTPDAPDLGPSLSEEKVRYAGRPVSNLPLGVLEGTEYVQFAAKLSPGDLVIVYTDGLIEARNPTGEMLEPEGLMRLARAGGTEGTPQQLADRLLGALVDHQGGQEHDDDLTVAVIRHTAEEAPPVKLSGIAKLLPRMAGLKRT